MKAFAESRMKFYKLVGRDVVQLHGTLLEHLTGNGVQSTVLWQQAIPWQRGGDNTQGVQVSTVFLGFDHNFSGVGPPLVFETMVFGARVEVQRRCSTFVEARVQHAHLYVACLMFLGIPPDERTDDDVERFFPDGY